MLNNYDKNVGFILSSITLGSFSFACLTSCIIFMILLYHLCYKRIERKQKMTFFLCSNIYLAILIYSAIFVSMKIRTILGDLNGQSFNSPACLFAGYMSLIMLNMTYMTFINQAFYRLVRVIYPQYRWLQNIKLYMILLVIELICICVLMCPLIPWNEVVYMVNDHFCYASYTNILGIVWVALAIYILPFVFLLIIYIRITIFLRQQPNHLALALKQRQARDFLVIRRILIIVSLLLVLGVPGVTLIIMYIITGIENPLSVRISFVPVGISTAGLSAVLPFSIPQLNKIFHKIWERNQVIRFRDTLPTGANITTIGNDHTASFRMT